MEISEKPIIGQDLESLRLAQRLLVTEAVFAFGLRTVTDYNRLIRSQEPLDFDLEFLFRLYVDFPGLPALTNVIPMSELFVRFYPDAQTDPLLRSLCMAHFAALFGRSKPTATRWIDHDGNVNPVVRRIVSKLLAFENARAMAEAVATKVHASRGTDFHKAYPLVPAGQPVPRRRGRQPTLPASRRTTRDG